MSALTHINGSGNTLSFVLPDHSFITAFSAEETALLNAFPLRITGNNNTVQIAVESREEISAFLRRPGLYIFITGHNNTVRLGKIGYSVNEFLGITGLKIYIGGAANAWLDPDAPRYASGCTVDIADGCTFCGTRIYLQDDNSRVSVGKDCMFSWGIDVWCSDVHTITDLEGNPLNFGRSIEIGPRVWVGKDVKVGKNTRISADSVIGWGSIVTRRFDETNVVIAGNPAKIIKRGIKWNPRDLQNYALWRNKK